MDTIPKLTKTLSTLQKCEKYVEAKEELEQDLYAKFIVVLNDKKAKIRELKQEVIDLENQPRNGDREEEGMGSSGRREDEGEESEEEEGRDDYENDTEDELVS